ncbi:hypothetical protein DRO47_04615 [Candidatus Bathyarchaeota archaeon]|nr:MAG: hypothetical protein DRO47_04615 [Candidatus Bathyarchaeota archaeon]
MCEVVRSKLSEFSVVEVGSRRQDREGDSQVHTGEGKAYPSDVTVDLGLYFTVLKVIEKLVREGTMIGGELGYRVVGWVVVAFTEVGRGRG